MSDRQLTSNFSTRPRVGCESVSLGRHDVRVRLRGLVLSHRIDLVSSSPARKGKKKK